MPALEFRLAADADLVALLALLRVLDPDGIPPIDRAREVWIRMRGIPGYEVWLARDGDLIVGTYSIFIMPLLTHLGGAASIVENVAVAEGRRGGGIGEAMMVHARDRARRHGCYKMALSSNQRRLDAHRFYRRLGFEQHGLSFSIAP